MGTAVIVSWITPTAPGSNIVLYWSTHENGTKIQLAEATSLQILQLHFWFHSPCQHQQLTGEMEFCFTYLDLVIVLYI